MGLEELQNPPSHFYFLDVIEQYEKKNIILKLFAKLIQKQQFSI